MLNDMDQSNVQTSEMYTLQLPSKQESITLLENLIEEIADKHKISEDTFANMMTCLSEAAINAIVHGNKLDPNKKVIVNADIEGHPSERPVQLALEELQFFASKFTLLGSYPSHPFREDMPAG